MPDRPHQDHGHRPAPRSRGEPRASRSARWCGRVAKRPGNSLKSEAETHVQPGNSTPGIFPNRNATVSTRMQAQRYLRCPNTGERMHKTRPAPAGDSGLRTPDSKPRLGEAATLRQGRGAREDTRGVDEAGRERPERERFHSSEKFRAGRFVETWSAVVAA